MRTRNFWMIAPLTITALIFGISSSCGSSPSSVFDGGVLNDGNAVDSNALDMGMLHFNDDHNVSDATCTNKLCNQSSIDDCAGKNKPFTSIQGTVYDPAGNLPLNGIFVYIPAITPEPINPGNPTCTSCQAPATGNPIISTLTDTHGNFTLVQANSNSPGVPSGKNIPLVIQTGKWRKQVVIPSVNACETTSIPNPTTVIDKLRLPANSSEGDMPLIAFTSGCDPAETFLRHIGISDSEFVAPTAPLPVAWVVNQTPVVNAGHIRFFTGNDNTTKQPASMVVGGNTPAETYTWWADSANLLQNDIVFNACECLPFDRGTTSYTAMAIYLNGGGRLFATHYFYNWFEPSPPADPLLFSVANWDLTAPLGNETLVEQDTVDQTFPKGVLFAQWLQNNNITTTLGSIGLGDVRDDINSVLPLGCEDAGTCLSTQWIYTTTPITGLNAGSRYISANTPVNKPVQDQCGKVVFSDIHLSGTSNDAIFPAECVNPDPTGIHSVNEKALEFLFFDLSSCVQDEKLPPVVITQPK